MRKRIISLFLCLMILCSLSLPVLAQEEITLQTLRISSLEDFLAFAENCLLDRYSQDLTVELTADICLDGSAFEPIPTFSGTFLGNGHTVSGLSITDTGSVQGLFRYLTDTAVVQDLNVTGSVHPDGSMSTVGGIAGSNAGTIDNCTFTGTLSGSQNIGGVAGINTVTGIIQNCRTEGDLYGEHFVGGIVGNNIGVIRNCTNTMQINTTPQQNSIAIDQITLDALQNTESANAVTDIGGIAGHSDGVIRSCTNYGTVGYQHMGYNVGGIAGSQMGYITNCVNFGAVSGRKEVGGIVGQMEPSTNIQFSEDTLQILQEQLNTLGSMTKTTTGHVQGSVSAIDKQITAIQDQAETAKDAVDQLLPNESDPVLPDADAVQAAQSALNSSMSGIQSSLKSISSSLDSTMTTLQRDMQSISNQVDAMGRTMNGASENLGGTITDISDQDTSEDTAGKVESCHNSAPVLADLNVGGIVGAIALENDLDPEEDVDISGEFSLNFDSELRAVILNCRNQGTVTGSKQNAGGIAGWMSMGLVKDSLNTGSVEAEAASYVGGIAGQSSGFIRSCSVKSFIFGDTYVGGIAGLADVVSCCRSMTTLSGTEKTGGVLGFASVRDEISENYYLSSDADPGAIDGISYDGCAQQLPAEEFLALEALEPLFGTITVRFCFEDGTKQAVTLSYGQALADEDIPAIPEKEGYLSYWEGLSGDPLYFDTQFTAAYTTRTTVIQSQDNLQGMPLLLAEGSFAPDATVTVAEAPVSPMLQKAQTLLHCLSLSVSASAEPVTVRCRLPQPNQGDIQVLVRESSGVWTPVASHVEDSYVVFPISNEDAAIAVIQQESFPWMYIAIAAAFAVLIAAVVIISVRKKKRGQAVSESPVP